MIATIIKPSFVLYTHETSEKVRIYRIKSCASISFFGKTICVSPNISLRSAILFCMQQFRHIPPTQVRNKTQAKNLLHISSHAIFFGTHYMQLNDDHLHKLLCYWQLQTTPHVQDFLRIHTWDRSKNAKLALLMKHQNRVQLIASVALLSGPMSRGQVNWVGLSLTVSNSNSLPCAGSDQTSLT